MNEEELERAPASPATSPTRARRGGGHLQPAGDSRALRLDGRCSADIFLGHHHPLERPAHRGLNPGDRSFRARDILVVHRSDGSGTTYVFSDYLSRGEPRVARAGRHGQVAALADRSRCKGNEGVAGQVRQTPGAIGYVEQVYARSRTTCRPPPCGIGPALRTALDRGDDRRGAGDRERLGPETATSASPSSTPRRRNVYPISAWTYLLVPPHIEDCAARARSTQCSPGR
jgi:phosphate transport system substrate-binding protein